MEMLIHAKIRKPDCMSNQEFFGIWKQEALAALEAVKAGIIQEYLEGAWKVRGLLGDGSGLDRSDGRGSAQSADLEARLRLHGQQHGVDSPPFLRTLGQAVRGAIGQVIRNTKVYA